MRAAHFAFTLVYRFGGKQSDCETESHSRRVLCISAPPEVAVTRSDRASILAEARVASVSSRSCFVRLSERFEQRYRPEAWCFYEFGGVGNLPLLAFTAYPFI